MTLLHIVLAIGAAICFYVGTSHSRIVVLSQRHKIVARGCGVALATMAIALATQPLGFWAGFFAVLTAFMLGCVAVPCVDAWLGVRNESRTE